MSACPYAVPGDGEDVVLEWWEELCLKYGLDPTPPPPVGPPEPIEFPTWLADQVAAVAEELTQTHLRPALEAAGVADPDQYSVAYEAGPVIPAPQPGPGDPKPAPPPSREYTRHRRPYLRDSAFSDTQTMPVIREP